MNKILNIFFIIITAFLFQACDIIGENDRLLDAPKVDAKKNVLLVEFTDQLCINCPDAAEEINRLKEIYGDTLVAVGMHASTLSHPLVTADGNTYEKYFETDKTGHPAAVIDGKHRDTNIPAWGGKIIQQLTNESPVAITLEPTFNTEKRELTIRSTLTGLKPLSGTKFQLWLTEDGVIDYQRTQAGVQNDYVHNHVFRVAVNGTWGENITLETDETKMLNSSIILKEEWVAENMHIVAFVFDDSSKEVLQATEVKLIK